MRGSEGVNVGLSDMVENGTLLSGAYAENN